MLTGFSAALLLWRDQVDASPGGGAAEDRQVEVDDCRPVGIETFLQTACLYFDHGADGGCLYAEFFCYFIIIFWSQRPGVNQLGVWQEGGVEGVVVDDYE